MENLLKELCPPKQQLTERQGSFMQRDQCLVSWKPKMSIKLGACLEANTTPTKKKKKKKNLHFGSSMWNIQRHSPHSNSTLRVRDVQNYSWNKNFILQIFSRICIKLLTQATIYVIRWVCKFQKPTISFIMSVHLSTPMEQLGSHWSDFHEIWH